ncbi:energy-coupling factor transporter transmembrane component T [Virgibacillus sp. SK37]|uniref:energy-coupling factor transporter transmembrane component T n=1 Tax=Virgibacillus sp. SK37 TaxID=403957 RepID=UPI0004D0CEAD|nr:energy-coupling factor transporter transmembrane component T [Virgibacillus sp. SK37]AIF44284.1 ABC transporter permease [Virgibacillus sp. SK37]
MGRGIKSYHPFILLLYYVLGITGFMLYQHPIFLSVGVLLIICFILLLNLSAELKKWGWMIFTMSLFIFIFTPLFNRKGNHILFYFMDRQIMLEAIIQGSMIALTLIGIMSIFITFNHLMTSDKFLFLFSTILPQWALLTMLSMRFVPLLKQRLNQMKEIQELKGVSLKQGTIKGRARNGMLLLQMLLTSALEESIQSADSMTARGYGIKKRTTYHAYSMQLKDWLAFMFLLVMGFLMFLGWWLGDGVLQLLPILEQVGLDGREYAYLTVWILLIGFPIGIEGNEVIKWKYLQQKI